MCTSIHYYNLCVLVGFNVTAVYMFYLMPTEYDMMSNNWRQTFSIVNSPCQNFINTTSLFIMFVQSFKIVFSDIEVYLSVFDLS